MLPVHLRCACVGLFCFGFLKYDQRGFGRHGRPHLLVGLPGSQEAEDSSPASGFSGPVSGTGQREWLPPFPTSLGQA